MPRREKQSLQEKPVFTTFDAARVCKANIASIKNWIAKGQLRAYRTPGGHYRIKRVDLERFLVEFEMPVPFDEKARRTVLMASSDEKHMAAVKEEVGRHYFMGYTGLLDAALFVGLERPEVLVVDLDDKGLDALALLKVLQSVPATSKVPVIHYGQAVAEPGATELKKDYNVVATVNRRSGAKGLAKVIQDLD